jgi:hypothetical protein
MVNELRNCIDSLNQGGQGAYGFINQTMQTIGMLNNNSNLEIMPDFALYMSESAKKILTDVEQFVDTKIKDIELSLKNKNNKEISENIENLREGILKVTINLAKLVKSK